VKLPEREKSSHKGERGRVAIVAGSKDYYGAPIFNALGAECSGADLITLFLPEQHLQVAKSSSLNLFLREYVKGNLGLKDLGLILKECESNHVLLMGSGLGRDQDTLRVIKLILENVRIPVVLDAEALFPDILEIKHEANWVVTPHVGEFKRLFGMDATEAKVIECAKNHGLTVLLKAPVDIISDGVSTYINATGCPEMRVGGTGDGLAGIVASFISQGFSPFDAACSAAHYFGLAGEDLAKHNYCFTTQEIIKHFPKFIRAHTS